MAVALITGAAKRIGLGFARALAADGWDIAIHCNSSVTDGEKLAEELREQGRRAAVIQADLSDGTATSTIMARAVESLGQVDLLINCASTFEPDRLDSITADAWDAQQAVNLRAPALLSRDFAAHVSVRGGEGLIINMLDQAVANLRPDWLSYRISKAGLFTLNRLLAMELAPSIRVNAIAPGLTLPSGGQTQEEFERFQSQALLGKGASVDDLAEALRYLIRADKTTGQVIYVDGGDRFRPLGADCTGQNFGEE
ncbi:MAG: SDR family oxidoreductase [Alphaproteobacteria bacterium]